MRMLNRLSARFVSTATEAGRHADGGGLYLSIAKDGRRRWVFLYSRDKKSREMGLGSAREVTLARAREKAAECRRLLAERRDPMTARSTERRGKTFGEAADELIEVMAPSWR